MSNQKSSSSSGIGLFGATFLVFLVLKLTEIGPVAHWSWVWVASPLWIGFGLWLAIVAAVVAVAFVAARFGGK